MATLITNQHNKHLIINLDNVSNIEKTEHFNIHFSYPAICVDAELYSTWKFENKKDCEETFGRIISIFDVVFL